MSEVTRYSFEQYPHESYITEDAEGRYVEYKDYAALQDQFDFKQNLTDQVVALQKQCDALAAENAALKESREILAKNSLETCNEVYCAGYRNTALHDGLMESTGNRNVYPNPIRAMVDEATKQLATPATDAYLNSVRADAVQALWDDSLNDVGHVLEEIGAYQDASEAGGIVHSEIQERVDDFVAQLRAGEPS